jgi:hypothetical protein
VFHGVWVCFSGSGSFFAMWCAVLVFNFVFEVTALRFRAAKSFYYVPWEVLHWVAQGWKTHSSWSNGNG